jgi:hypothetical protein
MNLQDLDNSFSPVAARRPTSTGGAAMPTAAGVLPNGFHTLLFPDGSHRTFRVHTKKNSAKFAPGKRIVSLLIGPDRSSDFEGFAFLEADGIKLWNRFRKAGGGEGQHERFARLLWALSDGEVIDGYELLTSKRCLICNRELTSPESLALGIGPLCAERMVGNG